MKYNAKLELTPKQVDSIELAKSVFKIDENSHSYKKAIGKILDSWIDLFSFSKKFQTPKEPVIAIDSDGSILRIKPDGIIEQIGRVLK